MCGNGLRCAAHYLAWRHGMHSPLRLETDMGVRRGAILGDARTPRVEVEVEMGVLRTEGVAGGETWHGHPLAVGPEQVPAFALSAGNPHLVLLRRGSRDEVLALGPGLSQHPSFVDGTNVEWVHAIGPGDCAVEVYERGVGRTLACGSGACAVAGALILAGHTLPGAEVRVRMPGGDLHVTIDGAWNAWLRGPSAVVFDGTLLDGEC
jgi:diaminopimelate epimerase